MPRMVITNPAIAKSPAFSPAVQVGPLVYVSGAGASDLSKDCRGQAEEVFQYISKVLAAAGCSMRDVIKLQAFVTRQEDYPAYDEVRRKYFPQEPPASTSVISGLLGGMLLEVEAVAYNPDGKW